MSVMLLPDVQSIGTKEYCNFLNVEWLQNLPGSTYFSLWLRWPDFDLPLGYNLYVVSFHLETVSVNWVNRQAQRVDAPIILLSDLNYYDYPFESNVHPYTYYLWHYQTKQIVQWFPKTVPKNIKYKASAFCNRITQSKMLIFAALSEQLGSDCLLKLDDWLEEKNVHWRAKTGVEKLDQLAEVFWSKYLGKKFIIDDFTNDTHNHQQYTADPYSRAYNEAAINFTNESFHYSYYQDEHTSFTYPGPFLTEKTLKCIAGGTPFIAVGQFETYKTLRKLGFNFDYSPIDLSWDNDPGNLSRLTAIIDLIEYIQKQSIEELIEYTAKSSEFNLEYVRSGDFFNYVDSINKKNINQILSKFK